MVRMSFSAAALAAILMHGGAVRVRQELRQLSPQERKDLFDALWTMKRTARADGQKTFGTDFQPYDYFTVKHAVAVVDDRGDQGHFGPCFMTFHRAFLLEFETSLLSVLQAHGSSLQGLPFWDATLDSDTGAFFQDPERGVFSAAFLGGFTGNASEGFAVTDGLAAHWPIGKFDVELIPEEWRETALPMYQGSLSTGLLRGPSNLLDTPYTSRLAKTGFPTLGGHNDIVYTEADATLCMDGRLVRDWMEWQDCIENARVRHRESNETSFWNHASGLHWMHSQFHVKVGSYRDPWPLDFPFMDSTVNLTMGDMMDVATSPNDPLFLFHHANVDRLNMAWQQDAVRRDPLLPSQNWGFPETFEGWFADLATREPELKAEGIWRSARHGCLLHDVANSKFPFTRLEGFEPSLHGHTHAEILEATSPGAGVYTYDTLVSATVQVV